MITKRWRNESKMVKSITQNSDNNNIVKLSLVIAIENNNYICALEIRSAVLFVHERTYCS